MPFTQRKNYLIFIFLTYFWVKHFAKMAIFSAHKECNKIKTTNTIPATFWDMNLAQQYVIIILRFCHIQIIGNLIAFCYRYVKVLSAVKAWFPSSASTWVLHCTFRPFRNCSVYYIERPLVKNPTMVFCGSTWASPSTLNRVGTSAGLM